MPGREEKHALSEARTLTSTLKRVRQNMHANVMQADSAVAVLLQDGEAISETHDKHKYELKTALSLTRQRLNRIKTAERNEKYFQVVSVGFFTSAVFYVILKRTRILSILFLSISSAIWAREKLSTTMSAGPNITRNDLQRIMDIDKEASEKPTVSSRLEERDKLILIGINSNGHDVTNSVKFDEPDEKASRQVEWEDVEVAQLQRNVKTQLQRGEDRVQLEAEEIIGVDSAEQSRKDAEEQSRKEKARKEADEKARREPEEWVRREAEENIRKEYEEKARSEVEENARREAEAAKKATLNARLEIERLAQQAEEMAALVEAEYTRREAEERGSIVHDYSVVEGLLDGDEYFDGGRESFFDEATSGTQGQNDEL